MPWPVMNFLDRSSRSHGRGKISDIFSIKEIRNHNHQLGFDLATSTYCTLEMIATDTKVLASGHKMPLVGFGLWKVPAEQAADTVYNVSFTEHSIHER